LECVYFKKRDVRKGVDLELREVVKGSAPSGIRNVGKRMNPYPFGHTPVLGERGNSFMKGREGVIANRGTVQPPT